MPEKGIEPDGWQVASGFGAAALSVQISDFCARILWKEIAEIAHSLMSVEQKDWLPELNRHTMIQYLLGELPPVWQEHFEEQFFTDKEKFEQLKLVEDQLVDDYVSEVLSPQQRKRFESHYLNSNRRRQKLKFAQTLQQSLAELSAVTKVSPRSSVWRSLTEAWRTPVLRYSFVALAVLAILGGSWLWRESLRLQKQRQQLEMERAALVTPTVSAAPFVTPATSPKAITPPLPSPLPSVSPLSPPVASAARDKTILSFVLSPGSLRDEQASTRTLAVTPQTKTIRLKLPLKDLEPYAAYRVVLETAAGQRIQTLDGLRPVNSGTAPFLAITLPAQSLAPNDYLVTLSGKKNDTHEEIEDYQFRIVPRP